MSSVKIKREALEEEYLKKDRPAFQIGDTVELDLTVREGEKSRLQTFSGIIIRRQGKGLSETFTVRKISYGEGVERIFPLHSPVLKDIRVMKKSKVRRAKLYYLRKKVGKKGRLKDRQEQEEISAGEKTNLPANQNMENLNSKNAAL